MTEFCQMSEDMVLQILSRLPPKSLMRFKCVRKSWNTLFNSPSFVAKHLSNSMDNKLSSSTCILLKRWQTLRGTDTREDKDLRSWLYLCNDNDDDQDNLQCLVEDLNISPSMDPNLKSLHIIGHCHGIICVTAYREDAFLCNPAIGEFKILPKSCLLLPYSVPYLEEEEEDRLETSTEVMGFGYDPKSKDYKVVRIVRTYEGGDLLPDTTEVYTMGTDSWREIKIDVPSLPCLSYSFQMYFKGIYYWTAHVITENYTSVQVILSFDMGDEVFHNVSLPDCTPLRYASLAVWNDSLAYFSFEAKSGVFDNCEVWVMDDFVGVKGSWTKQLAIRSLVGIEMPLAFWKSDELLMVATDGTVVSYNVSTETLKYLPFLPIHGERRFFQAIVYVNSIVSVKQGNTLEGIYNS